MSDTLVWITIAGLTLVTLLTRAGFLLLPQRLQLPPRVQRALRYAPTCALAAIIAPDIILMHGGATPGALDLSIGNPRLIAGLVAVVAFRYTRNMIVTILLGMAVFTGMRLGGF